MTPAINLPFQFAKKNGVFLESNANGDVTVVHHAILSPQLLAELRRAIGKPFLIKKTSAEEFPILLARAYEMGANATISMMEGMEEELDLQQLITNLPKTEDLLETQDDAPIIRLINAILTQAIKQQASDVHIETFEQRLAVRYRVDGVLREVLSPPRVLSPLLVSRIKVMAKLDIAEKRLPQDGRITLRIAGRAIDVRVSTLPSSHGERVVLRLLDKQSAKLDLEHLGMPQNILIRLRQLIHRPHGIILVTGPTGSGKTTTLYAALSELNDNSRNILTVEDPVEYELAGIGQTQVNQKIGMSFARGLRSILRQDPDVVMIGEIRDTETMEIAIQASLTGHLVLSTLHTNTAIGAITRLRDMGIESFLLASTLIGVAAQRLVRLLCQNCRKAKAATESEMELMKIDKPALICHPVGCEECANTGFRGRSGIYELDPINEAMRHLIHDAASEKKIEMEARKIAPSIQQAGFEMVLAGKTSLEEVLRVTTEN